MIKAQIFKSCFINMIGLFHIDESYINLEQSFFRCSTSIELILLFDFKTYDTSERWRLYKLQGYCRIFMTQYNGAKKTSNMMQSNSKQYNKLSHLFKKFSCYCNILNYQIWKGLISMSWRSDSLVIHLPWQ